MLPIEQMRSVPYRTDTFAWGTARKCRSWQNFIRRP